MTCDHNEMIPNNDPQYAWKCAKCGHIYGQDQQHSPELIFDEATQSPRDTSDREANMSLRTYAVTYFDASLPEGRDEGVMLFQALDGEHAMDLCESVSDDFCVLSVGLVEDDTQCFLVVSHDPGQDQWFYDIISTRTAAEAKSLVLQRRPNVGSADVQLLDDAIVSLSQHSVRFRAWLQHLQAQEWADMRREVDKFCQPCDTIDVEGYANG